MKVVLIKNYDKMGKIGDIKEAANGFVQNFLLPNKIALPATKANIARAEKLKVLKAEEKNRPVINKKELAMNLINYTLTVKEKVDDNGTLFAGVTRDKIAADLQKKGYAVKAKQIKLDSPIKKLGSQKVTINIDSGLKSVINVVTQSE